MAFDRLGGSGGTKQILSIHIPKTAGISLAQVYLARYGYDAVCFFYNHRFFKKPPEGVGETVVATPPAAAMARERLIRSPLAASIARFLSRYLTNPPPVLSKFPADVAVIHGHFRVDPAVKDQYTLVTVLREPLQRVHSLYRYMRRRQREDEPTPRWWYPEMTFMDMARLPQNRNAQWRYLNGLQVDDFAHIGVTEHLEAFVKQITPGSGQRLPHQNVAPQEPLELSDRELAEFRKLNQKDYILYERVLNRVLAETHTTTPSLAL